VYCPKGTKEAVGWKVNVVDEVSDHMPATLGVIEGIGLPVASGSVSCTLMGPAGDTPVAPDFGIVYAMASSTVLLPVV
jgi:hypothetical protein